MVHDPKYVVAKMVGMPMQITGNRYSLSVSTAHCKKDILTFTLCELHLIWDFF